MLMQCWIGNNYEYCVKMPGWWQQRLLLSGYKFQKEVFMPSGSDHKQCQGCYLHKCMLTPTMRKECAGPFGSIDDRLATIFKEDLSVKLVPLDQWKGFKYHPTMGFVPTDSCECKNPLLCEHSGFVYVRLFDVRIIRCRRAETDMLCPFPCDQWKIIKE